jgi:hypothetical protein
VLNLPKDRILIDALLSPMLVAACSAMSSGHSLTVTKRPFPVNGETVCASNPASPATAHRHAWIEQAKAEWERGEDSDAASEGLCWAKAADDLESITTITTTGSSGFFAAANQLLKLASLPDAMDTSTQGKEGQSLIASLDRFFRKPGRFQGS